MIAEGKDEVRSEMKEGWFRGLSQGLFAYAQDACYLILSTSTPTEALIALGPVTFETLLGNMRHLAVTLLGQQQTDPDRRFVLIRHKHVDPRMEQYGYEHYMPCMPAQGTRHIFESPVKEWALHLGQLKVTLFISAAGGLCLVPMCSDPEQP